jgi:hypothetical protein
MKKSHILPIFLLIVSNTAMAADFKTITLKDGSKVKGEVVSMSDSEWTIRTSSMGDVHIADKNISSIIDGDVEIKPKTDMPAPAAVTENITANPEFKKIQSSIVSDPNVMTDIQALIADPEIMALMSDPGLMATIQSGNTEAIQSNPKLKALSENPKIQAMIEKIKAQQGSTE